MFIPPAVGPFIISRIDDEGDNGGGEEQNYDDGLGVPFEPDNQEQPEDNDQPNPNDSEEGINPAWKEVLDILPKEFHGQITPKLSSWDKNFAEVQSKFAPYKPLVENNISYDQIQNSIALAQAVAADPHKVYMELGRRFGFGQEQGQPQVNDPEDNDEDENDPPNLMEQDDPRIVQLTQTVEKMQQMFQQQEQAKQEEQVRIQAQQEIDNEWSQLEEKVGNISPMAKKEIIQRAVLNGDQTGDYSLGKAYQDYAAFVNHVRNTRRNNTAPAVLNGNGGQPVTKKNIGQMGEDERIEHIAAMAKALAEGN